MTDFAECFPSKRVVILFSHWIDDSVEFDDGLHGLDAIVSQVPVEFDGVVDLCVCHPCALVMRLRRERPECLVKRTRSKARVSFWLQFYQILFRVLAAGDLAYSDAVAVTLHQLKGDRERHRRRLTDMKLESALTTFLEQTGRLSAFEALGPPENLEVKVRDGMPGLVASLEQSKRTSDQIIWVLVALHVALFAACVYIGVAYATDSKVVTLLLGGGSLLGILKIVTSLKEAWREKTLSDLLAAVAPSLSPRDLVTLIETIYHQKKTPRRRSA